MFDKNSAGFSYLADPEVATKGEYLSYKASMESQIKLHLLLSEHLLMPGGYLFDNPFIWELMVTDDSFRELLLTKTSTVENTSALVLLKHAATKGYNDDIPLDEYFRTWFAGADGKRKNNPSALRTDWAPHVSKDEWIPELNKMQKDWKNLTIKKYSQKLGLSMLERSIDTISHFHNHASSIPTPSDRLSLFYKYTKKMIQEYPGNFKGREQLEKVLNKDNRTTLSRSILQNEAPVAWEELRNQFIFARHSTYFENFEGEGKCSEMAQAINIAEFDRKVLKIIKEAEEMLGLNSNRKAVVKLNKLTYEDVLQIRQHPPFMRSIRELSLIPSFNDTVAIEMFGVAMKNWGENLIEATKRITEKKESSSVVEKSIKEFSKPILSAALGTGIGVGTYFVIPAAVIAGPVSVVIAGLLAKIVHSQWVQDDKAEAANFVVSKVRKIKLKR